MPTFEQHWQSCAANRLKKLLRAPHSRHHEFCSFSSPRKSRCHPVLAYATLVHAQEKLIFDGGCPHGDECVFAHSEDELKPTPPDYMERYHYELYLKRGEDLIFRGIEPRLTNRDAKAEVARMCLDALGYEVVDNHLRKRSNQAHTHAAGSDSFGREREPVGEEAEKMIQDAIKACRHVIKLPLLMTKLQVGKEAWLACLSSTLGKTHPDICKAIKKHFGSVMVFLLQYQRQFKSQKTACETQIHGAKQAAAKHVPPALGKKQHTNILEYITSSDSISESVDSRKQLCEHAKHDDTVHEYICCIVKEAGDQGISVMEARDKLAMDIQPSKSVKIIKLSMYFSCFPSIFRVMEQSERGAVMRVCWRENSAVEDTMDAPKDYNATDIEHNSPHAKSSFNHQDHTEVAATRCALNYKNPHYLDYSQDNDEGGNSDSDLDTDLLSLLMASEDAAHPTHDSQISHAVSTNQKQNNTPDVNTCNSVSEESLLEQVKQLQRRVSSLEAQLRAERDSRLCQICLDSRANTVILPCTHALYCSECLVSSMRNCPMCAGPILGKLECRMGLG
jgi:hypothetical protein